MTLNR